MQKTKKMSSLKDLQNHPMVDYVEREYNPNVFDDYTHTYWLYLKDGYWFQEEEIGLIHEPTIALVLSQFNSMTISRRTDGF